MDSADGAAASVSNRIIGAQMRQLFQACTLVVTLALIGCARDSVLDVPLASGADIRSLTRTADTTMVLVLKPEECFSCGVNASDWARFGATGVRETVLILTRQPSERERRELVLRRIRPSDVIAPQSRSPVSTPYVAWIADGRPFFEGSLRDQRVRSRIAAFLNTQITP